MAIIFGNIFGVINLTDQMCREMNHKREKRVLSHSPGESTAGLLISDQVLMRCQSRPQAGVNGINNKSRKDEKESHLAAG